MASHLANVYRARHGLDAEPAAPLQIRWMDGSTVTATGDLETDLAAGFTIREIDAHRGAAALLEADKGVPHRWHSSMPVRSLVSGTSATLHAAVPTASAPAPGAPVASPAPAITSKDNTSMTDVSISPEENAAFIAGASLFNKLKADVAPDARAALADLCVWSATEAAGEPVVAAQYALRLRSHSAAALQAAAAAHFAGSVRIRAEFRQEGAYIGHVTGTATGFKVGRR